MVKSFDVIIAGAGPVGLLLAYELARAQVSVLVLEKEATTDSSWRNGPLGMRGLNNLSAEAFYRRGLLSQLFTDTGFDKARFNAFKGNGSTDFKFAGHFAGIGLNGNLVDQSSFKYRLPGPIGQGGGPTKVGHIEAVLAKHAQSLGAEIVRGSAMLSLSQDANGVKVNAGDDVYEAKWLVGCDGGRSTVRHAAGFDFVGTEPEFTGYIAECELDKPELLKPGFNNTGNGMYITVGTGAVYVFHHDTSFDRSKPVTREHFQSVLQSVTNTDIQVKAMHTASSLTDRAKQTTTYRQGRVFLAGDAAHIHSPVGAQGLNLGIGDAFNLGWKLAAAVRGTASEELLDSYNQERHPIGARVLEWARSQSAALRPDALGRALYKVMQDVINTKDGTTYFVSRVQGLGQRYDLGDDEPIVGCSAPDLEFADGQRLGQKLESGSFLLLNLGNDDALAAHAESLGSLVNHVAEPVKESLGLKALLVRPDGMVAWAATDAIDIAALRTALSRYVRLPEPYN